MRTPEEQWVEAVQKIGSATLTHPHFEGRTARGELAVALWKAAMKGDVRAATLVLKYDLGIEVETEDVSELDEEYKRALEKICPSEEGVDEPTRVPFK